MTTKKKETSKRAAGEQKPHTSATAAAILGRAVTVKKNGEVKIRPEWAKYYERLLELRDQLTRQMDGLARESAQEMAGYSLHMADSGTDNFDRDFALSLLSSDQDAVYEIEEALDRIRNGTYGICEATGKPIEAGRLEAIPWTRFSAAAEKELEKQGVVRRARLSPREPVTRVTGEESEAERSTESEPADEE